MKSWQDWAIEAEAEAKINRDDPYAEVTEEQRRAVAAVLWRWFTERVSRIRKAIAEDGDDWREDLSDDLDAARGLLDAHRQWAWDELEAARE